MDNIIIKLLSGGPDVITKVLIRGRRAIGMKSSRRSTVAVGGNRHVGQGHKPRDEHSAILEKARSSTGVSRRKVALLTP